MAAAVAGPVRASAVRAGPPGRDRPGRRGPRRPGRTALPGRDRGSGRSQLACPRAGHHPAPPGRL